MQEVYGPFIDRATAMEQGLSWYFDGRECKRGHVAPHHVRGGCQLCRIAAATRWQRENKDAARQAAARYRASEKGRETLAVWTESNADKIREANAAKERRHRRDKTNRAISAAISCRIRAVLSGKAKTSDTLMLLGCSISELRAHLEAQWLPGMCWDNWTKYGWHIDHIRPCASFDLSDPEQQRECFHYTNLQPLWWEDNLEKGAKCA
jgi:hypothetical protein